MLRRNAIVGSGICVLALSLALGSWYRSWGQAKTGDSPSAAALRKGADDFVKAFNAGDAKAVANFWTAEGEYIGPDGDTTVGRADIEKTYVAFFKKNPKAKIEIKVENVRPIGKHTAIEEGTLKLTPQPGKDAIVNRYSALQVLDDDGWRMASVREWTPNPAELVTLSDVEWLVGDWTAKNAETEVHTNYTWDENKSFIHCKFSVKKDGKLVSSGMQIIGKEPQGGLRSWLFEKSGTYGESVWARDGSRWVLDSAGILPDGSTVTATNIIIPSGKDGFVWQSVDRKAAGTPLPDSPPIKVNRNKK